MTGTSKVHCISLQVANGARWYTRKYHLIEICDTSIGSSQNTVTYELKYTSKCSGGAMHTTDGAGELFAEVLCSGGIRDGPPLQRKICTIVNTSLHQ